MEKIIPDTPHARPTTDHFCAAFCNCSKYCGFQIAGSLEHGYLFFGDERAYTVMQAKDADKGGRSTIEEMPYSLNLAISP